VTDRRDRSEKDELKITFRNQEVELTCKHIKADVTERCSGNRLARLLQLLRKTVEPQKTPSQFLTEMYFDAMAAEVEQFGGLQCDEQGQRVFNRPSLPLLIGNVLLKCYQIKNGMAIRANYDVDIKEVERFSALYGTEWSN
jgi:hypothetical protein